MIEKMMTVTVVAAASRKEEMLLALRELGVLHLKERKAADAAICRRFEELSKTADTLKEYNTKKNTPVPVLYGQDFEELYQAVKDTLAQQSSLVSRLDSAAAELERLNFWGDFDPDAIRELRRQGVDLHIYRLDREQYAKAAAGTDVHIIPLAERDKYTTAASVDRLDFGTELVLPEKGVRELRIEMQAIQEELTACKNKLIDYAAFDGSFRAALLEAQNEESLSSAAATAGGDGDFVRLCGYLPADTAESFRQRARQECWGYALDEAAPDDEGVPTKLRFNKVTKLIAPVFDILGILPGYREQDISLWFLLFLTLFVAMILGDGGYGLLMLLGAGAIAVRKKKIDNGLFLVFVLSIATIIWGAVTGTWFALEGAMRVPFLKALVIPGFANYPEYFGLSATAQQNTIMKFSFSIGAIQMALGSALAIRKKLPEKDLSWIADLGWTMAVAAMYLLSLYLVIGESIPLKPVFITVGTAFLLVLLFGGMSPEKNFPQGLKAGLSNAFTVFLNTISCFGNVMSYIRLFAVGMASLAIAQSFNSIAAGYRGPGLIFGAVVMLIGHGLNLVMGLLSVVVHGVRLNVLEFSGQVGLEWTGIAYEPFQMNKTLKK